MAVVVNEMDVEVDAPERESRADRAAAAPRAPDEHKIAELIAYEQWKLARLMAD
ncbi:MAG TPA: hypothetical protein VMF52_16425 [Steroidobacteraceae bacterium]|nr:hypothetical protein [Steroidobacteraceae bacterium]